MKPTGALVAILAAILQTGCATTPGVKEVGRSEIASPGLAYAYGRFESKHEVMGFYISLGLVNVDSSTEQAIQLPRSSRVTVVGLTPGKYQVRNVLLTGMPGSTGSGKELKSPVTLPEFGGIFQAEGGKAYYIGDIHGAVYWVGTWANGYYRGDVDKCVDNYAATTDDFHRMFPKLSGLETGSIKNK